MLKPIKSLGQNYLNDKNILKKIAETIEINDNDLILEIGPGTGALTEYILKSNPKKLIAVDIDKRTKDILEKRFNEYLNKNFDLIISDVRELDLLKEFSIANQEKIKVCGNIPYYLTAGILFYLLEYRKYIDIAVLMLQKEVAQRIVAKHNSKNYGILSVILQLCSNVKKLFDVSPNCFYPKPKVTSTVIKIEFDKNFQVQNFNKFISFVKTIFNKRRKIIKNNLEKEIKNFKIDIAQDNLLQKYLYLRAAELNPLEIYELFKRFYNLRQIDE